jgi:hypothetical protein
LTQLAKAKTQQQSTAPYNNAGRRKGNNTINGMLRRRARRLLLLINQPLQVEYPSKCIGVQLPTLSPPTAQSLDGTKGHFLVEGTSVNRKMARRKLLLLILLSWLRRSEKIF